MSNIYSAYQHQSSAFQPEKLKQYRLRIVYRPDLLLYAVLSEENKLLAVKEYRSKVPMSFPEIFDQVYAQDYFLKEDYRAVEMVNSSLEFSLIPTVFFKPQQVRELAGALIKENADLDHLEYRDMEHSGATAIYTVPFPMKQKCDHFFPDLQYQPFCYLMVNMGLEMVAQHPNLLLLHIFEKQFVITAFKDGILQLCNAYDYEGVTDMVYFLQLVMEILKYETVGTKVLLSGEFEEDSEIFRQLKKFVPVAEIPKKEFQDRFETKGDKLPVWKYAFLSW
ncbi:MAG: DUF3822 family protein [Bacteroidetes bacterium]|nr:DUF3822 family protein [Bacteroidota bacterium]MBP6640538.1 DUF3822 family protein [Bacteroidia bacterium]